MKYDTIWGCASNKGFYFPMNYDTSISCEISLSRVLDELIMDCSSGSIVMTFLEQHEYHLDEMFAHSSFVFDLFDVSSRNPFEIEKLSRYFKHLPMVDRYFACSLFANFLVLRGVPRWVVSRIGKDAELDPWIVQDRYTWNGHRDDDMILRGDVDLVSHANSLSFDDFKRFSENTIFYKSLFSTRNFLRLSVEKQFMLLQGIASKSSSYSNSSFVKLNVKASVAVSLMKQLLMLGDMECFNWIIRILYDSCFMCGKIGSYILSKIPKSLTREIENGSSFEEVVFDMNLLESQFEPIDLFLYVLVSGRSSLFKGMAENKELLEFFRLPFDWNKIIGLDK